MAGRRPRRPGAVRRSLRHRLPSAGRRGPQRGPAAARHPGRAGRPRPPAEACYRRVDPAALARSLPGLATIGGPPWSPPWAPPAASPPRPSSAPSPAWPHEHPRPARPTAKANPSPRPATGCCVPPWSAPPTTPAAKTPSSPASTGPRWSSVAKTTSGRSVWSPPTWPSAPGRSWTAARPTSSATPTPPPSPPPRPSRSSPNAGPCLRRSAGGGAARRGRPLNKSCKDMCMALRRNEATLPFLGHSWPTTQPRQPNPAPPLTAKPP